MAVDKNRPFLKWAGNKYHCINHILKALPQGKRLIEPFTGSGAIFLNTHYTNYILAEGNLDLINLFTFIQQRGLAFIDYCSDYFSSHYNDKQYYYQFREQFNQSEDPELRAALFLYLNRHGYNGLCRYNSRNYFNVPFGRYKKAYFPREEMLYFYSKSQQAEFVHADFRDSFSLAKPGDVIYCDPPYVPLSESAHFSRYIQKAFNAQDQIDLVEQAKLAVSKGATVIISNHDTDFTREHYQDSEITSFPVNRQISCKAHLRLPVQELVAVFR